MYHSEHWKSAIGTPFEASSKGRVRVPPYTQHQPKGGVRQRELKASIGQWIEKEQRFIIVHRRRTYKIARLVCLAFHGLPPAGMNNCLHKDEDPRNNYPDNLKWGTQKENLNAPGFLAYCRRRTGENSPRIKGRINAL